MGCYENGAMLGIWCDSQVQLDSHGVGERQT